ncbi:MAG: MlaD family protein [Pseudomonadota bacterium]
MENKAHALITGLFTLVLLAATIFVGMWLNRDREERVPYQMATKLSVPGLNPQAAVRYRGLDVGKVDEILFDPKVAGQILVNISVTPETPVTKSTYGTLGDQGVTGIAYVQLDDDGSQPVKVSSSKEQVARIEMRPSLLDNLQIKGLAILQQTEELTTRVNQLLAPANQKEILTAFTDMSKAANSVGKAAEAIKTIPTRLEPTLAKLPAVVTEARQTLASVSQLSRDIGTFTGTLNTLANNLQAPEGPIVKISNAAEQVGSVASRLELDALPLTNDLRTSMRALNRTLDGLNERPQSILFGAPGMTPGPGEAGFKSPAQ